jgi:hypothetical protein
MIPYMITVNRSVAIIKPQKPFIKWVNSLPDSDKKYTDDIFQEDCLAILIPEYDTEKDAKEYINAMWEDIFGEQLWGWYTDETLWPKGRTEKMFWKWFKVEFHSMVADPYDLPIEKEDL